MVAEMDTWQRAVLTIKSDIWTDSRDTNNSTIKVPISGLF